jgi:hypothetical protein
MLPNSPIDVCVHMKQQLQYVNNDGSRCNNLSLSVDGSLVLVYLCICFRSYKFTALAII